MSRAATDGPQVGGHRATLMCVPLTLTPASSCNLSCSDTPPRPATPRHATQRHAQPGHLQSLPLSILLLPVPSRHSLLCHVELWRFLTFPDVALRPMKCALSHTTTWPLLHPERVTPLRHTPSCPPSTPSTLYPSPFLHILESGRGWSQAFLQVILAWREGNRGLQRLKAEQGGRGGAGENRTVIVGRVTVGREVWESRPCTARLCAACDCCYVMMT